MRFLDILCTCIHVQFHDCPFLSLLPGDGLVQRDQTDTGRLPLLPGLPAAAGPGGHFATVGPPACGSRPGGRPDHGPCVPVSAHDPAGLL